MSASADSPRAGKEREALARLEAAAARAIVRIRELEAELRRAERRVAELDRVLSAEGDGGAAPSTLIDRARALEQENAELRRRLGGGREGIERLLAKIRFLEEQR